MKIFRSKAGHTSDKPRIFTEQESRAATVEQAKDSKRGVKVGIASLAVTATIGIASLAITWLTYSQQVGQPSSGSSPLPPSLPRPHPP